MSDQGAPLQGGGRWFNPTSAHKRNRTSRGLLVREKLPKEKSSLISEGRPDLDAYQVVYLIIGAHSAAPWKSLPFFSKVALMQATRHLRLIGFPVSLAGTSQEDESSS
jgi:uncharacterized protein (TIGR04141 family)